jgi:small-conductance mechanosensitive channel
MDLAELVRWLTDPVEPTPFTPLRIAGLVAIVIGVWFLASLVERTIHRVASQRPQSASTAPLVYTWARIVRYAVWIAGTVVGLGAIGFDVKSLAFLAGTIAVGIGFGLQNIFSNFISGMIILLEGTLKIRDFVELESGVRGHVREIGLRFTRVQTNDEVDVLVPNSEFINKRVTNWTFEERRRRMRIRFIAPRGADKDRIRELGVRAAERVEHTDRSRPAEVWLVGFSENRLELDLVVWVGPSRVDRPNLATAEYLWALEDELRGAGIVFPAPRQDLQGTVSVRMEQAEG